MIANRLQQRFGHDKDLIFRRLQLGSSTVTVIGFKSLVNFPQSLALIRKQIGANDCTNDTVPSRLMGLGQELSDEEEACSEILDGMLLLVHDASGICISLSPIQQPLTRSIESPITENVVRGPSSAFNEDILTNIGLLRKQLNSDLLRITTYKCGSISKNRIVVSYLSGRIQPELLESITSAIESHPNADVNTVLELSKVFGFPKLTLVSRYNTTELPQSAASALMNGRAVLFIERFPFAVILPSLVSDLFVVEDDQNHPIVIAALLRATRLFGILTTILFPSVYVALVSVNPEVLRFELAHSIAISRLDVPYPAIVETLLLLLILELILEAIIRLPANIGPTVTMVGGIVLGEAVVSAKLVSNLLIIILAAVTISNAVVVGYQNALSIRFLKYLLLFLASAFGVLGIVAGLAIVCSYLAGVKSLGIPYLQMNRARGE